MNPDSAQLFTTLPDERLMELLVEWRLRLIQAEEMYRKLYYERLRRIGHQEIGWDWDS